MSLTTNRPDVFIGTNSGRVFYPWAPRPHSVHMPDVIHSLSNKTRWNGHIDQRYTVAQHSVEVMLYVEEHGGSELEQFYGLMHDTLEAYCVDMPKPIKVCIPDFCELEEIIWNAIAKEHGIDPKLPEIVHEADKWQLFREAVSFFPEIPQWVMDCGEHMVNKAQDDQINFVWNHAEAKYNFTRNYERLYAAIQS